MPRSSELRFPQSQRLLKDWRVLCQDIGQRLAGSDEEQRAADFVQAGFQRAGAVNVRQEEFACRSLQSLNVRVGIRDCGRWRAVPCQALVGAPSTPGKKMLEGRLRWLALPEGGRRLTSGSLAGEIAVVFGPLPDSLALHRRLLTAAPLAVIHVDERLPFAWAKNDGVFPEWQRHGLLPTVTIPYTEAWDWRRRGLERARVSVQAEHVETHSQNVVAELPGANPKAAGIIIGAHHDTQNNNVGADDNASGVVSLLALARMLARRPRRRTIRLVSFGCEEQLSVGAKAYVEAHRAELANVALMLNLDSISSVLGHYEMFRAGAPELERWASRLLARHGVDVRPNSEVCPFSDHFCFTALGVPSLFFFRGNFPGGRWQHHSQHDNLDNVAPDQLAFFLNAFTRLVLDLADRERLPFPRRLDRGQAARARELAHDLYGLET